MNQSTAGMIAAVMPIVRASGLLVSLCTIRVQPDSDTFDAGGAPDPAVPYVDLESHVDIPCIAPPLQVTENMVATERATMEQIESKSLLHVLLDNYYPDIPRPGVDGPKCRAAIRASGTDASTAIEYDVVNVENDSQRQMTRLALQLVEI